MAAARLRGDLATAAGRHPAAAAAFQTAWRHSQGLRAPLALAQLEISDARRLRAAGQPQSAIARLRAAQQRLLPLGAQPYLQACDRELAAAAAPAGPQTGPALPGLTPAGETSGTPKARDGAAEAIRMLRVARRGAAKAVSQAANQLRDLIVTASGQVREQLTGLPASKRVEPCSRGLRRLVFCGSGLRPISHRILTLG